MKTYSPVVGGTRVPVKRVPTPVPMSSGVAIDDRFITRSGFPSKAGCVAGSPSGIDSKTSMVNAAVGVEPITNGSPKSDLGTSHPTER